MKHLLYLVLFGALLLSAPLHAVELDGGDPVTATLAPDAAPIARVVLYPEHALVTRRAEITLAAGRQSVRFVGLPMSLDRESLRVGVDGAGELLAVHADTTWAEAERNALVAEVMPKIEGLLADLQKHTAGIARADARLRHVDELAAAVQTLTQEEMGRPKPDLTRVSAALDGLRSDLPGLLDDRRDDRMKAAALQYEIQQLRERLAQVGYPEYGAATRAVVRLQSAAGGRVTVELSYGIAPASWSPRYQLRAKGDTVELVVQAEVQQSTGEDWSDVQFGISTSSPKGLIPAPDVPRSVATSYERETRGRTVGSSFEDRSELDEDADFGEADKPAGGTIRVRGAGFQVDAVEKATVRADGRSYRVVLVRSEVAGARDLYVAPERASRVLRRVRASNNTGLALLPGPADVFADSGFIGTTRLAHTAAGAPLAFALGAQEGLTVLRTLDQARYQEVDIGLRKKVHYDVQIEATNTGTKAQDFVVEERIPVSRLKELKVQVQDETTAGYELDAEQGFVRWTVSLPPGAEKELRLYYVLDMPRDFSWQGM